MRVVLDTSAVLALMWGEPGAERVARHPGRATVSAANLAEVVAKLVDRGLTAAQVAEALGDFDGLIEPMPEAQGLDAGLLRGPTRALGLSLGDRACLALARSLKAPVMTADRSWAGLDLGVTVEVIR
jgi:PIN domain nuclease of toxin-antitoxin system